MNWHYIVKADKYKVDRGAFLFPFQKHENEEDGASGNNDGGEREKKETDVAISFVFGQNIKDRAKVGRFPLVFHLFLLYSEHENLRRERVTDIHS